MAEGGLLDDDGVSLEAFAIRKQIREHDKLRSRCVLVDEVQDCSTVELAVIAEIATSGENGLFLTGDPVQKVYAKQHDLVSAGVDIVGRGAILRRNYRNSRQILMAAFRIIDKFKDIAAVPKNEILEPEFAFRDGSLPSVYECSSREEQQEVIMWFLSLLGPGDYDLTCIAGANEQGLQDMEAACADRGIPTFRITGGTSRKGDIGPGVKLSLLQDIKGFEFKQVFLIDLMDSYLLPKGMPWEERWRVAFQLYVAMTRARDDLIMSYVYNWSILLGPLGETIEECTAKELLSK